MNQRSRAAVDNLLELVWPPLREEAKKRALALLDAFILEVEERAEQRRAQSQEKGT